MSAHFRRVWTWPLVIAAFSLSGLLSALVSDGWGDVWAWLALGLPLMVIARFSFGRRA
jgi:hypothetical protein